MLSRRAFMEALVLGVLIGLLPVAHAVGKRATGSSPQLPVERINTESPAPAEVHYV